MTEIFLLTDSTENFPPKKDGMNRLQMIGRILPTSQMITLPYYLKRSSTAADGTKVEAHVTLWQGTVRVTCDTDATIDEDVVDRLRFYAIDSGKALVNSYAFIGGSPLYLDYHTAIRPDGSKGTASWNDPGLRAMSEVFEPRGAGIRVMEIQKILHTEPYAAIAMSDLIQAITEINTLRVHCARAIEGLRHLIAGPGIAPAKGWGRLQDALNVDRAYRELITRASVAPRHGDYWGSDEPAQEIVYRSWTLMNRFLEFRMRGNQNLRGPEFPLLSAGAPTVP